MEDYSVPESLTPVSAWREGFSAEDAYRLRRAYTARDYSAGTDAGVYAYLNLGEVLTTMTIHRDGPVRELPVQPLPGIGEVRAATALGRLSLNEAMADPRSRLQGIAVVHQGAIVFEAYPGMAPHMKHVWNSTTKPIGGLLIHMLEEEGRLDLSTPVRAYLPDLARFPVGGIRVADILHMRAGLDWEETNENIANPAHPIGRAFATALTPRGVPAGPGFTELLEHVAVSGAPGEAFEYSTYNAHVLGLIIEAVEGRPWNEVVSDRIWSRIGAESDALVALSASGEPLSGGAIAGRLRDLARFAMLFLPSSQVVAGTPLVSESYFEKLRAAVRPEIYLAGAQGPLVTGAFGETGAPRGNAYQWDAVFEDGDLYKPGLCGQGLYVSPGTDTAVVWVSTTWANTLRLPAYARAIVTGLFREGGSA